MTELTVTRGRDIELYADGERLYGVTRFRAVSRINRHDIFEYLSGVPYDSVNAGESHELEIKALSLFRDALPTDRSFVLTAVDGGTEYSYSGCRVVKRDRNVRGDKLLNDVYTVKADSMTKRRISDDG